MKNFVVETYENYHEEDRLTTNNARRIEFLNTIRVLNELLPKQGSILDCAAGTGIYSFYFADKGYVVTATDITPRHIDIIRKKLQEKNYLMNTEIADATNLSLFENETFDVVLNMGPFYHIIDKIQREKCLSECLRVLKKGGLLITSYIPRFYVFQYVALSDSKYINAELAEQIIKTGTIQHDNEYCFWTDSYYSTKDEMEKLYYNFDLAIIDHFAQDGITPLLKEKIDQFSKEQFQIWCDYNYSICRESSILGMSNHAIIVGQK